MNSWTEGYVAEIGYTYGYYPELNPLRMRLPLLYAGLAYPPVAAACELGFGQGLSIVAHAAASAVEWHGTDFNPSQAALAQELAGEPRLAQRLRDEAFADYCARGDLPDFDFMALHGIWSWVNEANRETLLRFMQRKLKPGGVVFMSHNTLPGWSTLAPVRRLMADHAATASPPGESVAARVDAALAFVDKLLAASPAFAASAADLGSRVAALKSLDRGYLAHEYFNQAWAPMYHGEVAAAMARAKLSLACPGRPLELIDALNLSPAQHALLAQIADPTLRQTARDFLLNTQFRKDYWIKGPRRLSAHEQSRLLREQRVVLVVPRPGLALTITGATGEAGLAPAVYTPLLDALADHRARSLGELEAQLAPAGVGFAQLAQAVIVLLGQGRLAPAQTEAEASAARPHAVALNRRLMAKACGSAELGILASPVTGGGQAVPRANQLFLLALSQGHADPAAWARYAWELLAAQGQSLLGKDGKPLKTAADNVAQLTEQGRAFAEQQLAMLQALKVA